MAELAGLVLGALPLVIWVLEKYSEPFETLHKYRVTIESFRDQLAIQNYQLEKTLSTLGLSKNASREELRKCFEIKFPQISHELFSIVRQMDDVIAELTKSLNVSIDEKPSTLSNGVQFNWSRVKNSLNTKKRNRILENLRNLNEDLRRVVEKPELPEEVDSSKIQELKLSFSPQQCSSIRKCLISLHRALGASLRCACPSPHQAAVDLDWESCKSNETQIYKVAFSYKGNTNTSQYWEKLHITPYIAPKLTPPHSTLLAPVSQPRTPSPTSSIKSKIVRFASFSGSRALPSSPTLPNSISVVESVERSAITARTEITNLCSAVCAENSPPELAGYLKDPEKDLEENDYQQFILDSKQPSMLKIIESFHLERLISLGDLANGKQNPIRTLSAKQRYGIAASIACESWNEKQAKLSLEINMNDGGPDSPKFYLSYLFSTNSLPEERSSTQLDELIPNRAIFGLGIVLVKLCILDLGSGSLIEDYCTAVRRLDDVRRIAGTAYGDAAERCIKFCFSGHNHSKNFDVKQFRRSFYDHVVAPVQAAYYLMPG
ncbi:hypothetical protein F4679DRAFT_574331 [Xylaria curta]|nr:hypothetical protein F4679DRAFT_574331 [Xylaria curta]